MATKFMIMRQGDFLIPATNVDLEQMRNLKQAQMLKAVITNPRNLKNHKRGMAMLNLAFQYWVPESVISSAEAEVYEAQLEIMKENGVSSEAASELFKATSARIKSKRSDADMPKDFEAFRAWVKIKSGYYNECLTPDGIIKMPKSIDFGSLDESGFRQVYKSFFNVCWEVILRTQFSSPAEAEGAAMELLNFDS